MAHTITISRDRLNESVCVCGGGIRGGAGKGEGKERVGGGGRKLSFLVGGSDTATMLITSAQTKSFAK